MTKSQVSLRNALIKLLEKRSLSQISVKKLCQEANVSRSTFYTHYGNVNEILEEIEDNLIHQLSIKDNAITDESRIKPQDFSYFSEVLDFVSEHKREVLVLTKFNPDPRFVERWKSAIKVNLKKRGLPTDEFVYELLASEVIAAFDYYLLNNEQLKISKIQEIISKTLKIFEN